MIELVGLFLHLSSWGRCTRLLWYVCRQRATGAQTLMQWFSTALCSRSPPVHGTGSDSIRLSEPQPFTTGNLIVIFQYDNLECVYLTQVGFTSVSDYITYTWVKDDEVAFNEEVIQVVIRAPMSKTHYLKKNYPNKTNWWYNKRYINRTKVSLFL